MPWRAPRRCRRLRVGLHLVLVEGKPVLPAGKVPDLVDATGHFRTDMARAGAAMFFLPKVRDQLKAEIEAQFAAFAATGLALDHVNAHKHFHLHPTIARFMVEGAKAHGAKGRAGAAGAAGRAGPHRAAQSVRRGGADHAFRARVAGPVPPRPASPRRIRSSAWPGRAP